MTDEDRRRHGPALDAETITVVVQAYYNKHEGPRQITTETGAGQWGTAIALARTMVDPGCTVSVVMAIQGP